MLTNIYPLNLTRTLLKLTANRRLLTAAILSKARILRRSAVCGQWSAVSSLVALWLEIPVATLRSP